MEVERKDEVTQLLRYMEQMTNGKLSIFFQEETRRGRERDREEEGQISDYPCQPEIIDTDI